MANLDKLEQSNLRGKWLQMMRKVVDSAELSLLLAIDAEGDVPLHRQLYHQLRDAILAGKLRSHTRLPASRQLAKTLSLSRTTVVQSYDQLISEGYLQARPGAGTFVCSQLPDDLVLANKTDALVRPLFERVKDLPQPLEPAAAAFPLSAYGHRLAGTADYSPGTDCPLSFRYGLPDLSLFPVRQWRRLQNRYAVAHQDWMAYGAEPMGYAPLRQEIAQYILDVRAVRCTPEQILITNGTQQALSLIVQVLLNLGEAIALENPGYLSARRIFLAQGARLVPVPIDDEGIRVDEPGGLVEISARSAQLRPKLVYVTPSHQFPTGVSMSLSRRLALLKWARDCNALIVEDDYDSEFRYSGRPIPALQGLDEYNRVLYVGTFSKVMFPGLRLGYVAIPPPLVDVFQRAKWLCDRQGSLIDQVALAAFIRTGQLAQHVRRMRNIYGARRRSLVELLQQTVKGVSVPGDASGLHVLAQFQAKADDCSDDSDVEQSSLRQLIDRAQAEGVSLFGAQEHYCPMACPMDAGSYQKPTFSRELIFGFGGIDEVGIREAIARIQPLLTA